MALDPTSAALSLFFFSPPPAQLIAQGGAGRFQIPATLHESNSIALQPAQWHPWQVTDWRGGWAREQGWKELDPGSSPDFSGKRETVGPGASEQVLWATSKSTLLILLDPEGAPLLANCVSEEKREDRQLLAESTVCASSADWSRLTWTGLPRPASLQPRS